MKHYSAVIIIALIIISGLSNCKHQPNEIPIPEVQDGINNGSNNVIDSICFADSIAPLLHSNCAKSGCHDDTTHQSGINLTSYNNVISTISGNLLMQVIQDSGPLGMPVYPYPKLTAPQTALIQRWINEGMKNNVDCGNCPTDTTNVSFSTNIFPVFQSNCIGCHNIPSSAASGPNLVNYDSIKIQVDNGKINCVINHLSSCSPMPKGLPKLCDGTLAQIKKWINSGAPNN